MQAIIGMEHLSIGIVDSDLPPWAIFLPGEQSRGAEPSQRRVEDASGDNFLEQCVEDAIFVRSVDHAQSRNSAVFLYLFLLIVLILLYFQYA